MLIYIYIYISLHIIYFKGVLFYLRYTAEISHNKIFEINYVIYHIKILEHVRVTVHKIWKGRPSCRIERTLRMKLSYKFIHICKLTYITCTKTPINTVTDTIFTSFQAHHYSQSSYHSYLTL
jgi:hypothetical protein